MASTSASTSAATEKHDPALMGVPVPLSVTLSAAKQVGAAWQKFGLDLVQAVKTARETKTPPDDKSAGESSASAAAGVNA